jgi:hypothetical protein
MVTSSTGYDFGKRFTSVKKIGGRSNLSHLAKLKFDDGKKLLGHFGAKKSVLFVVPGCKGAHIMSE